jgi:hypothetical protein
MGLLIKNGEIVTSSERFIGDVYCEDGLIKAVGLGIEKKNLMTKSSMLQVNLSSQVESMLTSTWSCRSWARLALMTSKQEQLLG